MAAINIESTILKSIEKIEASALKNKTIREDVIFHLIKNAFMVGVLYTIIYVIIYLFNGFSIPFNSHTLQNWMLYTGILVWGLFSFLDLFTSKSRALWLALNMYRLGKRNKVVINTNATQTVNEPVTVAQGGMATLLIEDVKTILTNYYNSSIPISRDNAIKLLEHRSNSKRSAEEALNFLLYSGVIEKGPNRNSPIIVKSKTLNDAKVILQEYINSQ